MRKGGNDPVLQMRLTEISVYSRLEDSPYAEQGYWPSVVLAGLLDNGFLFIATERIYGYSLDQCDVSQFCLSPFQVFGCNNSQRFLLLPTTSRKTAPA